eukprot:TRINITY_DN3168_c0_g1_i1.p1 TRINITY_DN3168_c0_g1~~TRINITY_DN3168_c0_g1_i1.p1  ORF type:complete len:287 (+),score=58.37 TRINITY_DN3168_c0_g1_i1:63-923(+)
MCIRDRSTWDIKRMRRGGPRTRRRGRNPGNPFMGRGRNMQFLQQPRIITTFEIDPETHVMSVKVGKLSNPEHVASKILEKLRDGISEIAIVAIGKAISTAFCAAKKVAKEKTFFNFTVSFNYCWFNEGRRSKRVSILISENSTPESHSSDKFLHSKYDAQEEKGGEDSGKDSSDSSDDENPLEEKKEGKTFQVPIKMVPLKTTTGKKEKAAPKEDKKAPIMMMPYYPTVKEDNGRRMCSICMVREPDTILLPCGHVFCGSCCQMLTKCAVCREAILLSKKFTIPQH